MGLLSYVNVIIHTMEVGDFGAEGDGKQQDGEGSHLIGEAMGGPD